MADATRPMTVIGPDTHIKGEMVFDSTARILGTFEGKISAKGEVQIGEGAACKAAVEGTTVIVDGVVEGDITARERVHLNTKAKVIGDIVGHTMVVAEGASFIGHCRVGADAVKGVNNKAPVEQSRPRPNAPQAAQQPTVQSKPNEIEATLAGLEARLSGMSRRENGAAYTNGSTEPASA